MVSFKNQRPYMHRVIYFSIFLITLLVISSFSRPEKGVDQGKCDNIEIKAKTNASHPDMQEREVLIELKNAKQPVSYFFYGKDQKALTSDIKLNSLKNLKRGTYKCTIIDSKGCTKTVEFTI